MAQSVSGSSVSLSSNGSIVAIGAPLHDGIGGNSGHVQIFRYENENWIQIGNDLDGERQNDRFGTSVSLSSDGNIVAIGAPLNFGNGANSSGEVSIYENINDEWIQIGDDIGGEGTGNQS